MRMPKGAALSIRRTKVTGHTPSFEADRRQCNHNEGARNRLEGRRRKPDGTALRSTARRLVISPAASHFESVYCTVVDGDNGRKGPAASAKVDTANRD